MKEQQDLYLVPYDFSNATEEAFAYALNLAKTSGGKVVLAHVTETDDDAHDAKIRLVEKLSHLDASIKDSVSCEVMTGSIYDDLDKIAKVTHASFVVMGTHGVSGFQKIFGSNAQKVVGHSHSPFILLQEGYPKDPIDSIVMPFNFDKESLQVTTLAAEIAAKYDATIHLVGYQDEDEWLLRDMKTNEAIVRKHLTQHGIKHDTHLLPGKESYEAELVEYAHSVGADLIAAAFVVKGFLSYYHSFLDTMLTNKYKIPVLTVNAEETMTLGSRFTFITT